MCFRESSVGLYEQHKRENIDYFSLGNFRPQGEEKWEEERTIFYTLSHM